MLIFLGDSTILLTWEYTNVIVVHYNNMCITIYYNYDHTILYRHSRENRDWWHNNMLVRKMRFADSCMLRYLCHLTFV